MVSVVSVADLRYIAGSLLLRVLAGSLKSNPAFFEKHEAWRTVKRKVTAFWGTHTLPNLYNALVYERKFKSEYLKRQIYQQLLESEPSIVNLIENSKAIYIE